MNVSLTSWPTVNFGAGEARPNNTITAVAPGGLVCVVSAAAVDVVVDVSAVVAAGAGLEYRPAAPQRLGDTRANGRVAAYGVVAVFSESGQETASKPVDLKSEPEALAREWLTTAA
jgi:hypothetical protein